MIDFSKPIRHKPSGQPAFAVKMRAGWAIEWQDTDGEWVMTAATEAHAAKFFENVPPPQEWRWEDVRGYIGSARYASPAEAHLSCRQHAGQPVRILREGETP